MANEKSPAYQWYPKDILSSIRVAKLTLAEEGAYRRALDFCWLNDGLPSDPKEICSIIGKGCSLKIVEKILPLFKKKRGSKNIIYNDRQEIERTKQRFNRCKNAKNGQNGAKKRWQGVLKTKKLHSQAMISKYPNDSIAISIPISIPISSSDKESVNTRTQENVLKIFKEKYPKKFPNYDTKILKEKKELDEITDGLEDTIRAEKSPNEAEKLLKLKEQYESKLQILKNKKEKIISDAAGVFFDFYNKSGWKDGRQNEITNMESAVNNWLNREIEKQQKKFVKQ